MKQKMKRALTLFLAVCLIAALLPATALAAGGSIWVGGVEMQDGEYLASGASAVSAAKPAGGYAYYKDGVLTLNNYSYNGEGYCEGDYWCSIYADENQPLEIRLYGSNSIGNTKVSDSVNYEYGCGIWTEDDLLITGPGSLTIIAPQEDASSVFCGGDFTIRETTVTVNAWNGLEASKSMIIENAVIDAENVYHSLMTFDGNLTIRGAATDIRANASKMFVDSTVCSFYSTVVIESPLAILTPQDGKVGKAVCEYENDEDEIVKHEISAVLHGDGTRAAAVHIAAPAEPVPETGDGMDLFMFAGLALMALIGMAAMRRRSRAE